VVECEDGSKVESGETAGGVCWGMVVSKISDRRRDEKVRFASSAEQMLVNFVVQRSEVLDLLRWK
jgi:hypothetical protein